MLKEIKWLAVIAVALIALGAGLDHLLWPKRLQTVTIHTTDTLTTVRYDTVKVIITRKGQITTLKDTIRWEDTTAIASYQKLIEYLTSQETVIEDNIPTIQPSHKDNFDFGVMGGVGIGMQSKTISPIIACPVKIKRVLVTPFAEYNDEFRVGAMAGMNF